jgi:transposase
MYIETVPNRHSPPTILLREAWREGPHVRKRTLANLTHWPTPKIEALRLLLQDVPLVSAQSLFVVESSLPHGAVEAVVGTMRRLGLDALLASKPCRERQLVLAMIAERLLHPSSKLGTTRLWHTTTLAEELEVANANEDDLYHAMDWLLARQARIEQKLAKRHLVPGSHVLYDVTSSYYEGRTCPLARFGYNRDQKQGTTSIVYGVLTDRDGRPVAVEAYRGNTADPTTIPDQVTKLRTRFRLEQIVLVGDRGTLTQTQIEHLKQYPGLGWIAALRFEAIRQLVDQQMLTPSQLAHQPLAEITCAQFPGERLVACYNPLVAHERHRKRPALLEATEADLASTAREVARRTKKPLTKAEIGQKVGRVLHHYHMAKHFEVQIDDGLCHYARRTASIQREAELDGIYVIRTSEPAERLSAEDTVRGYKNLAVVERLFRTLKSIDILVRPIHHHQEKRVRAHIFLCVLAYYVEWHMRQALAPLLFDDEELEQNRKTRDPVAPAQPSPTAQQKKARHWTADGLPIHSFATLLVALGTRCRNRCRVTSGLDGLTCCQLTEPTPLQQRAFQLLGLVFPVNRKSISMELKSSQ